jgi:hypothetical protein
VEGEIGGELLLAKAWHLLLNRRQVMNMRPRFQKIGLLAHIAFSVGWFGAIVPYLALAIAALTRADEQAARGAYLSMELIGWFVIVPLSAAALLSGLLQSLGTQWGLFRHWWIVAKFALTIFACVILFQHMRDVSRVAHMARDGAVSRQALSAEFIHSAGGLVVLLGIMTLSIFKPWGMTAYGRRRAVAASEPAVSKEKTPASAPVAGLANGGLGWRRIVGIHAAHAVGVALLVAIILHTVGMRHH